LAAGPEWLNRIEAELAEIKQAGLYRSRKTYAGRQGVCLDVSGRSLVNFSSNDYLGLAGDSRLERALIQGAEAYGVGSGASHLVCGHSEAHHRLEEELACFLGRDRVLLFSTGYMANLGVLSSFVTRHGAIYEDRLNHASLIDGARLSGGRLKRYPHGSLPVVDLPKGEVVIASDGVFSMDGDLMQGAGLVRVAQNSGSLLMVDDAHGLGVLGETGAGTLEHQGLGQDDVPILMGTFGKALGSFGAFVAGPAPLIDYLIQRARTYIYTTAMPPAVAQATRVALGLVQSEGWRRERLFNLVARFQRGARQLGIRLAHSDTPIQPILIGDSNSALEAQSYLFDRGFLVVAIRPPTVPVDTARLRCTLTAGHTEADVDRLLDALASCPNVSCPT
jgi:8-amino-7-oxononanoate synthase